MMADYGMSILTAPSTHAGITGVAAATVAGIQVPSWASVSYCTGC